MRSFKIPGCETVFYQHNNAQAVSSDTYELYIQVREYIHKNMQDKQFASILDIGTGTGIILLMLAMEFKHMNYTGVEIVKEIVDIANTNFENLSSYTTEKPNINIINADYCKLHEFLGANTKFDLIVSNPPYFPKGTGIMSSIYEKAVSRFELAGNLYELIKCIKYYLNTDGKAFIIYPDSRVNEVKKVSKNFQLDVDFLFDDTLNYSHKNPKKKTIFEINHAKN